MSFELLIPTANKTESLALTLSAGQMLFILGANGTGKSSLLQAFSSSNKGKSRRITAHRQTWFKSGSPEFTGQQRAEHEMYLTNHDMESSARWKDDWSNQRTQMAIYDLVNHENVRARNIAQAVDQKNGAQVEILSQNESVFLTLNRLLRLANIGITLSVKTNDEIMATRNGGQPYSISKLSDGERNAILIASNVLTAPTGTLLLIDEPERHLHRSIISPLLSLLLKERKDCAFIVSTHEPLLPADNSGSKVLLMRSCTYENDIVTSYEIDLLENTAEIDDDLKCTILGERRKILFVEGVEHSLDKPLYSLLFPNTSIVAKNNCREVEHAVVGIKGTTELHWVKPFGFVDNDTSEESRIADLKSKGVFLLNVYSIESIYYHPELQRAVGEKLASVVGGDLEKKLAQSKTDAIKAIRGNAKHLSDRIAEKAARAEIFSLLPKKGEIGTGGKRMAEINFDKFSQDEVARIEKLLDQSDFIGILQRYPIRESGALDAIAKALNFSDRLQYEAAIRKLLEQDSGATRMVQSLLGDFPADLITQ